MTLKSLIRLNSAQQLVHRNQGTLKKEVNIQGLLTLVSFTVFIMTRSYHFFICISYKYIYFLNLGINTELLVMFKLDLIDFIDLIIKCLCPQLL